MRRRQGKPRNSGACKQQGSGRPQVHGGSFLERTADIGGTRTRRTYAGPGELIERRRRAPWCRHLKNMICKVNLKNMIHRLNLKIAQNQLSTTDRPRPLSLEQAGEWLWYTEIRCLVANACGLLLFR